MFEKIYFALCLPDSGIRPEIYEGIHTRVAQGNQEKHSVDVAENVAKNISIIFSHLLFITRERDLKSILKRIKTTQQIFSRKKAFLINYLNIALKNFLSRYFQLYFLIPQFIIGGINSWREVCKMNNTSIHRSI